MSDKLQWALQYADMGLSVFPLIPNRKEPATSHGFKEATRNKEQIENWWKYNPEYNVGIATGALASGEYLFVIDIDIDVSKGKNGQEAITEFEHEHGRFPTTAESRTPRGGRHLLFKSKAAVKCSTDLYNGVDVRGIGGYIVAPPSTVNGTRYRWINPPIIAPIAEADTKVFTFLSPVPKDFDKRAASSSTFSMPETIDEGSRTNSLIKLVGSLQSKGLSDEAIRAAVYSENDSRCNPPLTEQELERTVFSALRRWRKGTSPYTSDRDYSEMTAEFISSLMELRPEKNGRYGWHDAGNGNLFSDLSKRYVRFVLERKKWYFYDGLRWIPDIGGNHTMNLCKTIADALVTYTIQNVTDEKLRADYLKFVTKWQGFKYRETILKDAATVTPISTSDFDKDKFLFNCKNGTLDLRSMNFREHDCKDLITHLAEVEYRPEIVCERWKQFISEIMCGDDDLSNYLQKALGYALTGDTKYECFFILYGATSRNGKGTLCDTFSTMLGDYSRTASPETIAQRKYSDSRSPSEDVARLAGARYVNMSEPDKKMILSASLVKTLTGNDVITARFLGENSFEFKPQFKMFINTNHLPYATDATLFASDRVKVIPFNRHFEANERDETLKQKLTTAESLSGILNWCVEGLNKLSVEGLKAPKSVREATQEYSESCDKIGQFISSCLVPDAQSEIRADMVHVTYQNWCWSNRLKPESFSEFKKSLASAGIEVKRARPADVDKHSGNKAYIIYGYAMKNE